MKSYIFEVVEIEDSDDLALQLSDEFCKDEDWREDDVIQWIDLKDGTYQLVNKTKASRK